MSTLLELYFNDQKRLFGMKMLKGFHIVLPLRFITVVNVSVYYHVRQNTTVLRHVCRDKQCTCFVVYNTTLYDCNTVLAKRVMNRSYTVVIFSFTAVYVIFNCGIRSFTLVVMLDLGINENFLIGKWEIVICKCRIRIKE